MNPLVRLVPDAVAEAPVAVPWRVVGFDPGLRRTGYAVLDAAGNEPGLVEAGVIRIPTTGSLARRLVRLHADAKALLDDHRPMAVAVEELFSHYQRPRTAILMGHARGVLLLAAGALGVPVASYLPARVKKTATGHGRASKAQMQAAMQREFGLDEPPEPPDVADALAVALCHFHRLRRAG